MKNKKKYWLIPTALIAFFIVPLLINVLFKYDFGIEYIRAEWTAGDALSFYGAIVASLSTVLGVFFTVKYSNEKYRNDIRNKVLPFFTIEMTGVRKTYCKNENGDGEEGKWNIILPNEDMPAEEFEKNNYIFYLDEGTIEVISAFKRDFLKSGNIPKRTYIPIVIKNIGVGTALFVNCGLYKKGEKAKEVTSKSTFCVNDSKTIYIIVENIQWESNNNLKYIFDVDYRDMYGNQYRNEINIVPLFKNGKPEFQCTTNYLQKVVYLVDNTTEDEDNGQVKDADGE